MTSSMIFRGPIRILWCWYKVHVSGYRWYIVGLKKPFNLFHHPIKYGIVGAFEYYTSMGNKNPDLVEKKTHLEFAYYLRRDDI